MYGGDSRITPRIHSNSITASTIDHLFNLI